MRTAASGKRNGVNQETTIFLLFAIQCFLIYKSMCTYRFVKNVNKYDKMVFDLPVLKIYPADLT